MQTTSKRWESWIKPVYDERSKRDLELEEAKRLAAEFNPESLPYIRYSKELHFNDDLVHIATHILWVAGGWTKLHNAAIGSQDLNFLDSNYNFEIAVKSIDEAFQIGLGLTECMAFGLEILEEDGEYREYYDDECRDISELVDEKLEELNK